MLGPLRRYARWLHGRWPAATVERFPEVRADGSTRVPGVYVSGDLKGIPLLKFALDSGARVVARIAADLPRRPRAPGALDLVIVGGGVSGLAAALEAKRRGLSFRVVESARPFATLIDFPKAKPIYTYPLEMVPAGALKVSATVKEALVDELERQIAAARIEVTVARAERIGRGGDHLLVILTEGEPLRARSVLVAIGRSGAFRRLDVPGEDLGKVYHRLHDPADFAGKDVLVVGGGDTAAESAIALTMAGARVTLSCRGAELTRPKPENLAKLERLRGDPMADVAIERPSSEHVTAAMGSFAARPHAAGSLEIRLATQVKEIREREAVLLGADGRPETVANDVVFAMLGRRAPLDFFRRSGVPIAGEMTPWRWSALGLFLAFCSWLYNWKSGGWMSDLWHRNHWFPTQLPALLAAAGGAVAAQAQDPRTLIGTLVISASSPSFWYTLAYSLVVVIFGIRRMVRRRTPYVTVQTLTLMAVQVFPLFLVPEVILPQLQYHGQLPRALADALFPVANYGHGREFWRAYGLILAWPLNVYNLFTHQPLWWWIAIGFVQTCILIPLGIYFFGKGVYCGWICSCGALAETLGDDHRHKMPHGPRWNRANLAGQVVLGVAFLLLLLRITGWALPPGNWADAVFEPLKESYKWTVDVFLAGVLGYGLYFWYSGRVWCRFLCPLAALMHVYARFSRFAIVADKKKCISCSVCTSVCHQGIDVMSFANRGLPMQDPECVRCSACVHACPTGVLTFGQVDRGGQVIALDALAASPVQMRLSSPRSPHPAPASPRPSA
jgi:NosR/NirI family transcriptional regulator, nitrous oxide reductase regulator